MHDNLGYLGVAVVLAGLWHANPLIVGSGLSFLLIWRRQTPRAFRANIPCIAVPTLEARPVTP